MPWCETCSRYWVRTSMAASGECPTCGRQIAEAVGSVEPRAPWHFKLLVVAVVAYLALRAWQAAAWLVQQL